MIICPFPSSLHTICAVETICNPEGNAVKPDSNGIPKALDVSSFQTNLQ
jgi:hypothetical protein